MLLLQGAGQAQAQHQGLPFRLAFGQVAFHLHFRQCGIFLEERVVIAEAQQLKGEVVVDRVLAGEDQLIAAGGEPFAHQGQVAGEAHQRGQPGGGGLLVPLAGVLLDGPLHQLGQQGVLFHIVRHHRAGGQLGQQGFQRFTVGVLGRGQFPALGVGQGHQLRIPGGMQPPPGQLVGIDMVGQTAQHIDRGLLGQIEQQVLTLGDGPRRRLRLAGEVFHHRGEMGKSANIEHALMRRGQFPQPRGHFDLPLTVVTAFLGAFQPLLHRPPVGFQPQAVDQVIVRRANRFGLVAHHVPVDQMHRHAEGLAQPHRLGQGVVRGDGKNLAHLFQFVIKIVVGHHGEIGQPGHGGADGRLQGGGQFHGDGVRTQREKSPPHQPGEAHPPVQRWHGVDVSPKGDVGGMGFGGGFGHGFFAVKFREPGDRKKHLTPRPPLQKRGGVFLERWELFLNI